MRADAAHGVQNSALVPMESDASVGQKPPFTLRQVVVSCAHLSILLRSVYVAAAGSSPRSSMKGAHFAFRAGRPWDDGGDIIVVRGNPLFGITNLANVEVVVKDGTV
jgi:hypothetical protein